jgi:hypothetical protein
VGPHELRDVRAFFSVELDYFEARGFDALEGAAVRVAAAGDPTPWSLPSVLPVRQLRIVRADMLEKDEAAARVEDAADLAEDAGLIVDAA